MEHKVNSIEIGRVVLARHGPSKGKIGVIVDVIDKNRCIIDGPSGRQIINIRRLSCIKFKFKIVRGAKSKTIHKILTKKYSLNKNSFKSSENKGVYAFTQLERIIKNTNLIKKFKKNLKKTNGTDLNLFAYMIGKQYEKKKMEINKINKNKNHAIIFKFQNIHDRSEIENAGKETISKNFKFSLKSRNSLNFLKEELDNKSRDNLVQLV
mmetsp:Transcript_22642/g.54285  ORF Transcript_22642/g.54285 Transcript_22642/m.54285 type:complete len:209 (+) Transcript_22642:524-1150(+)